MLGGGAFLCPPPQVFHEYVKKRWRCTPPFLACLFIPTSFPHMWRFRTQVTQGQRRSPGHFKWPHLWKKSLNARHNYTECLITYKMYISEFWYPWTKVRSVLRPLHDKEKNERRLFWKKKIIQNTLKHRVTGRLDTQSQNVAISDSLPCRQGHFRSWKVTCFRKLLLIETS